MASVAGQRAQNLLQDMSGKLARLTSGIEHAERTVASMKELARDLRADIDSAYQVVGTALTSQETG